MPRDNLDRILKALIELKKNISILLEIKTLLVEERLKYKLLKVIN